VAATLVLVAGCGTESSDSRYESVGEPGESAVAHSNEPPMFRIDENATGPLTMDELQFTVPAEMKKLMSARTIDCWREAIEKQAQEAGDPAAIDPTESELLSVLEPEQWAALKPHMKRAILAQALMSSALRECQ
jgi:hypothetical protein